MKLRIALALALALVVLAAIPVLAAPRVTVEATFWVGWISEGYGVPDYEESEVKNGYSGDDCYGPYLIPGLRLSVGAWPLTDIVLSGWMAGCFRPTEYLEPVSMDMDHTLGLASAQLGVENAPAASPNIRLLGGIKWMYLTACDGYEGISGHMVGPYVGFALRRPIADQLMFTGGLTAAVLMGDFDYDYDYLYSVRGGGYDDLDGAYPVFDWDLGLRYNASPGFFIEGGIRGCTIVGTPATTPYYRHPEEYNSAMTVFGAYTTLGYQF